MIALAGTTVGASTAFLVAADLGASHPAVAWVVATVLGVRRGGWRSSSRSAARRVGVRTALMVAVTTGTVAAATLPILRCR